MMFLFSKIRLYGRSMNECSNRIRILQGQGHYKASVGMQLCHMVRRGMCGRCCERSPVHQPSQHQVDLALMGFVALEVEEGAQRGAWGKGNRRASYLSAGELVARPEEMWGTAQKLRDDGVVVEGRVSRCVRKK